MTEHTFIRLITTMSDAYISGDYDSFRPCCTLPVRLVTASGTYTLHTEDDLRTDFDLYVRTCQLHDVTDIVRQVRQVTQASETRINGTYTTHLMRGAERIKPPYDSTMSLRMTPDGWRIFDVVGAVGHTNWGALGQPNCPPTTPGGTY